MNAKEYQEACARTQPTPEQIQASAERLIVTPATVDLLHAAIGVGGEAGELLDAVKRAAFYGKPIDLENVKEEIGDTLWYLTLACKAAGTTLEECMALNIHKLKKRYPHNFSEAAAIERADKYTPYSLNVAPIWEGLGEK